jgi:spoIIIJ-associated protein
MAAFVEAVTTAMGLSLEVAVEPLDDGTRITINGDGCELFIERKAVALEALQHIINAAFRRDHPQGHIVVDCQDYRKGKDAELRETATFLVERARETGVPEEIGPLNPYARRVVHLAIAEIPGASSESIGDAFMKTVVITAEKDE